MNRQPIDLDDPRLTDFALGEMPKHELKEFEQQLGQSPLAQKELDAMEDIMVLLATGLKSEWNDRSDVPASLELLADPVLQSEKENVVAPIHNFGKSARSKTKMLSLAAVLTGMLVVGSLVLNPQNNTGRNFAATSPSDATEKVVTVEAVSVDRGGNDLVNVPALLLADEVKDFDVLVAELKSPMIPVDDSYLDGGQMIKASYSGGVSPASLRDFGSTDSYFPSTGEDSFTLQLGKVKSEIVSNAAGKGRMKTYTRSGSWSGSGRLGLTSSHNGMQADLADILEKMDKIDGAVSASQAAQIKSRLRGILKQSKEIGSQLAH